MCNDDWNTRLRRCPEKMSSLGGPTSKKYITQYANFVLIYLDSFTGLIMMDYGLSQK